MKKIAIIALLASLHAVPVLALETNSTSRYDHRIRCYVTYNADDVVQVDTVLGVATHIMLEEGEQYLTHAFGNSDAYAFAREGRDIFIKPKAELAKTKLCSNSETRMLSVESRWNSVLFRLPIRRPPLVIIIT